MKIISCAFIYHKTMTDCHMLIVPVLNLTFCLMWLFLKYELLLFEIGGQITLYINSKNLRERKNDLN